MATVYEATRSYMAGKDYSTFRQTAVEFDTLDAAKACVEGDKDAICGKVITWAVSPNLPGCLPAMRYNSCALTTYDEGKWTDQNIHG